MSPKKPIDLKDAAARLAEFFDVPVSLFPWGMDIELLSDRDVFVTGCTGISEYTKERIVFRSKGMTAVVDGDGLELFTFADGRVKVSGRVANVAISRGDSDD